MEVPVKVLYRTKTPWWEGLRVWTEFPVAFPACGHIECLLSTLLSELITGEPSEEWAVKYRQDFHRSLRVGDAVVVGENAFALEPSGWVRVALQDEEVVVIDGLTRMRSRQSSVNRWRGNWRDCMAADVPSGPLTDDHRQPRVVDWVASGRRHAATRRANPRKCQRVQKVPGKPQSLGSS